MPVVLGLSWGTPRSTVVQEEPGDVSSWHGHHSRPEHVAVGGDCQPCSLPRALLEGDLCDPTVPLYRATSMHI